MRGNIGEIVNIRRARKPRAAAMKDAAANRAESAFGRTERSATERARRLEEKRLDAHRREVAGDPSRVLGGQAIRFERENKTQLSAGAVQFSLQKKHRGVDIARASFPS
ncbi:MAG: DUF4169 family protein [Methylocella sp.]